MYQHMLVGSNDIAASKKFYDAALGALGHAPGVLMEAYGTRILYHGRDGGLFMVAKPRNGEAATHGNGSTISFKVDGPAQIDAFYAEGMANGGTDEGPAGPRDVLPGAYAAYLRDPDGNKICAFWPGEQQG